MSDMSIEFLPLAMANPLAEMTKRAEAAEARLKEWETAANNNDPYVTNGGYVEVEVLEAVKRHNAELLARAETAEAQLGKEVAVSLIHARENDALSAALREQRLRAEAAEARVKELEIQPFETSSCATLNTAEDILRYDW